MPLNPAPDPGGNVAAYKDAAGTLAGRVLSKGAEPLGYERVYMPHFATCPARKKAAGVTPGVTQLDEWKRARAEHARSKRNRRGRRPGPERYLGFTRPPG